MTELAVKGAIRTVTLGMGCFWSPEALFGSLPGVAGTRVGFAGGTTDDPEYRDMGDHSETVEIAYDDGRLTLEELLRAFWDNHNPDNINGYKGRQYRSLLLYRDERQLAAMRSIKSEVESAKGPLDTEIAPLAAFFPAEPRHRKYYVKRYPDAIGKLNELYESEEAWTESTLAARLNGLAKGYVNLEPILREIGEWALDEGRKSELTAAVSRIRW